jgi:hypothetical protein
MAAVDVGIDILYSQHFAHDEKAASPSGLLHRYKLSAERILPGTLVGSVYLDDNHLGIFAHKGSHCVLNIVSENILSVDVNEGDITIVWGESVKRGTSKVVASYEYKKD